MVGCKMKKVILGVILILLFLVGCSAKTSLSTEDEVTNLVNNYLVALKNKDISSMVKYTDDSRFPIKKEQKEQYSNINQEIKETKIIEVKMITETEFEATVEIIEADDILTEVTFPIKKQEKVWKIVVGQDL